MVVLLRRSIAILTRLIETRAIRCAIEVRVCAVIDRVSHCARRVVDIDMDLEQAHEIAVLDEVVLQH